MRAYKKLILKRKIMKNPKLRDLTINVEETPLSKGKDNKNKPKKQKGKNPEAQTKKSVVHTRKTHGKEDETDTNRSLRK